MTTRALVVLGLLASSVIAPPRGKKTAGSRWAELADRLDDVREGATEREEVDEDDDFDYEQDPELRRAMRLSREQYKRENAARKTRAEAAKKQAEATKKQAEAAKKPLEEAKKKL